MVAPLLALGAGVMAGGATAGLLGGKKTKTPDIAAQLEALHQGIGEQRIQNDALKNSLNPLTTDYKTQLQQSLAGQKSDFAANKSEYLGATDANTKAAQDAMRANLYSKTFSGVPDTLQALREASAAGGGLKTGSYQKAVGDVGNTVATNLGTGERDIQLQGLQNRQGAQENTFNAFNNLSSKLSDQQMEGLTKVLDTGREDLVRQYTTSMGLTEQETQGVIDLLNFQQSGQMAGSNADEANRMALIQAIIGGGGKLAALGGGK